MSMSEAATVPGVEVRRLVDVRPIAGTAAALAAILAVQAAWSPPAQACSAPHGIYILEATVPEPNATDVPPDSPVIAHLLEDQLADLEEAYIIAYSNPLKLTLYDKSGEVASKRFDRTFDDKYHDLGIRVRLELEAPLEPATDYRAVLETVNLTHFKRQWHFSTASTPRALPDPGELEPEFEGYYELIEQTSCCEEDLLPCGYCATVIGSVAQPAARVTVPALGHGYGRAAWLYSLQVGHDFAWRDLAVKPAVDDEVGFEHVDPSFGDGGPCLRVVASSQAGDRGEIVSEAWCPDTSAFGPRPDIPAPVERMCQSADPGVVAPGTGDEDGSEIDASSDGVLPAAGDGCACTAGGGAPDAAALLLGLMAFGRRRERNRR